ncbi:MAG: hypothetical protein AAB225_28890 [Acidobacteriota bacterium]
MASYRIYRLKDAQQQQFRWAPHAGGATPVKRRDYQEGDRIEAATPYAAWSELRERSTPLRVGDLLEGEAGELRICKYVGLEEARWVVPEAPAEPHTDDIKLVKA